MNQALLRAAELNHSNLIGLLLDNGADITSVNEQGRTPIEIAARQGNVAAIDALLGSEAEIPQEMMRTALEAACALERTWAIDILLEDGNIPQATKDQILIREVREGRRVNAGLLLNHGANIEVQEFVTENTPLQIAAENQDVQMLRTLLTSGHPIQGEALSAALVAASQQFDAAPILETILNHAQVPQAGLDEVLLTLSARDEVNLVNLLIERGANIDATNEQGETPLIRAAWNGQAAVAETLLVHGANIGIEDNEGLNAAEHAENEEHEEIRARITTFPALRIAAVDQATGLIPDLAGIVGGYLDTAHPAEPAQQGE